MAIAKKGMFFTLITIIFLSIFVFYFGMHTYRRYSDRVFVVETRVETMNNFIKSVERDLERGLYISSFRALLSLEGYMAMSGNFFEDVNESFNEVIINGTVNNTNFYLMYHSRLTDWVENIKLKGNKLGIELEIQILNISLYQSDSWHVAVGVNTTLFFNDTSGIASWYRERYIETSVDIRGFEDPLYIVNGIGRLTNVINESPYDGNFVSGENVSNLLDHIEHSYYVQNSNAPSFLARFMNSSQASLYGIESLVNLVRFNEQGLPVYDRSCVDYIYWSNIETTDYRINHTPSWFKLDEGHLDRYDVSGLAYIE